MAASLQSRALTEYKCLSQVFVQVRQRHFNVKKPWPKPIPRRIFEAVTEPIYPPEIEPCERSTEVKEEPHAYEKFVIKRFQQNVFNEKNKMIIVCQPVPMSAATRQDIYCTLKENGFSLRKGSNQWIRHAITGTRYEPMLQLFVGTSEIIVSETADISKLLMVTKKLRDIHILGGLIEDRLLTKAGLLRVAELPNLELLRGELVSILNMAAGGRTTSLLNSHQQRLSANLTQLVKQGSEEDSDKTKETVVGSVSENTADSNRSDTVSEDPTPDSKT